MLAVTSLYQVISFRSGDTASTTFCDAACGTTTLVIIFAAFDVLFLAISSTIPVLDGQIEGCARVRCVRDLTKGCT